MKLFRGLTRVFRKALMPQNVKKRKTSMPLAAAPVAITNAAIGIDATLHDGARQVYAFGGQHLHQGLRDYAAAHVAALRANV